MEDDNNNKGLRDPYYRCNLRGYSDGRISGGRTGGGGHINIFTIININPPIFKRTRILFVIFPSSIIL